MMAEKPNNWWSLAGKPPPPPPQQPSPAFFSQPPPQSSPPPFPAPPPFVFGSSLPPLSPLADHQNLEFPLSWSQLLLGGLGGEEKRGGTSSTGALYYRKQEEWDEDHHIFSSSLSMSSRHFAQVKQELDPSTQLVYQRDDGGGDEDEGTQACSSSWSSQVNPPFPAVGCNSSNNFLDFSNDKREGRNQNNHHSPESYSTAASGAPKRARVQPSSAQPPLKVRKKKLGDRISALHQLVSPFGKTDTASVLLEAMRYIRFLEGQIEALSSPYLGNAPGSMRHPQFDVQERSKDLKSRGMCLVPVSCTDHVDFGDNIGVDYWSPALGGGSF